MYSCVFIVHLCAHTYLKMCIWLCMQVYFVYQHMHTKFLSVDLHMQKDIHVLYVHVYAEIRLLCNQLWTVPWQCFWGCIALSAPDIFCCCCVGRRKPQPPLQTPPPPPPKKTPPKNHTHTNTPPPLHTHTHTNTRAHTHTRSHKTEKKQQRQTLNEGKTQTIPEVVIIDRAVHVTVCSFLQP